VRNVAIAEWIVARFTSKKRAAAIVGDLLELAPENGRPWFWLSLAGVILSLAWRRPLAFAAALCVYFAAFSASFWRAYLHFRFTIPDPHWRTVWGVLFQASNCLWFIVVYAAIRHGVRDRVTRLLLALSVPITAGLYCWERPTILVACIALTICVLAASTLNNKLRRGLLIVVAVLMVNAGIFLLTAGLIALCLRFLHPAPTGNGGMQPALAVQWVEFCMLFLIAPLAMTSAYSRMHNWLMRDPSPDSQTQV
jgi:hypothetical protein